MNGQIQLRMKIYELDAQVASAKLRLKTAEAHHAEALDLYRRGRIDCYELQKRVTFLNDANAVLRDLTQRLAGLRTDLVMSLGGRAPVSLSDHRGGMKL